MADISPIKSIVDGVPRVTWTGITTTTDTPLKFTVTEQWGLAGSVQFVGTFAGGSTAKLQMSNDGTNWVDIKDLQGGTISATATGIFEFTCSAAYIKPVVSGGSADNVNVILVLRGLY